MCGAEGAFQADEESWKHGAAAPVIDYAFPAIDGNRVSAHQITESVWPGKRADDVRGFHTLQWLLAKLIARATNLFKHATQFLFRLRFAVFHSVQVAF